MSALDSALSITLKLREELLQGFLLAFLSDGVVFFFWAKNASLSAVRATF
jgi:hypothetical protein